jgi:hypothetical protein
MYAYNEIINLFMCVIQNPSTQLHLLDKKWNIFSLQSLDIFPFPTNMLKFSIESVPHANAKTSAILMGKNFHCTSLIKYYAMKAYGRMNV